MIKSHIGLYFFIHKQYKAMLEITKTVINKDAQVINEGITYAVHYIIDNGVLTSIQCAISKEENDLFTQLGFLRKENGRLNTDFNEDVSYIEHLTMFQSILTEVEADVATLIKKR